MYEVRTLLLDRLRCRGYKVPPGCLNGFRNIPAVSNALCNRTILVYPACVIDICDTAGFLVGLADEYRENDEADD